MTSLVSIIVPIYNSEKYIGRCIESLINQTKKDIEIILVNDGSTDNSLSIINGYEDSRIKIIDQPNKGVTHARNNGVQHSLGDYIMFVDSDDFIELNTVELLCKTLKKDKSDIVKCNQKKLIDNKYISDNLIKENIILEKTNPLLYDYLYETICFNSICKQLIKKELFNDIKINYDLKYGEDLRIMMDIIRKANKISFIKDELYIYNINSESFTQTNTLDKSIIKLKDSVSVYYDLYNYVDVYGISPEYKKKAFIKILFYISYSLFNLNSADNKHLNYLLEIPSDILVTLRKDFKYKDIKQYSKSNFIYRHAIKLLFYKKHSSFIKLKKVFDIFKKIK